MIVSFSRKFIFIKTRKTAGTSIEIMLSRYCGPEDIVTPIMPADEILRAANGGVLAQNYSEDPDLEAAYREAARRNSLQDATLVWSRAMEVGRFYNHMNAARIRENLNRDFWGTAFKFTIERHPYEKVVSLAYWNIATSPMPIDDFLDHTVRFADYDDSPLYSEAGTIIVDKVFRYEDLPTSAAEIRRAIGVDDSNIALVRAKGHHRKDGRPAVDILTKEQKRVIQDRSAFSFDQLGYQP